MSEENKEQEKPRGPRGEVGEGTPAARVKALWKKSKSKESLKDFAAKLIKEGNADAQKWFDAKAGKFEEKRSEKNIARIQLEKQASKSSRK